MSSPFQLGRAEAYPIPTREAVSTDKAPKPSAVFAGHQGRRFRLYRRAGGR